MLNPLPHESTALAPTVQEDKSELVFDESDPRLAGLKALATQSSVCELARANKIQAINSMLANNLLTLEILDPAGNMASAVAWLLDHKQFQFVAMLLDKKLISAAQLADMSRGSNAIAILADKAALTDMFAWGLLQRFLSAGLIPLGGFFKRGEDFNHNLTQTPMELIQLRAPAGTRQAVNTYCHESVSQAIQNDDREAVRAWLDMAIKKSNLLTVAPAIHYLLQSGPTYFGRKMHTLTTYLLCSSFDASVQRNFLCQFIHTEMKAAPDFERLKSIYEWFADRDNMALTKPFFTIKKLLKADDTTHWQKLNKDLHDIYLSKVCPPPLEHVNHEANGGVHYAPLEALDYDAASDTSDEDEGSKLVSFRPQVALR